MPPPSRRIANPWGLRIAGVFIGAVGPLFAVVPFRLPDTPMVMYALCVGLGIFLVGCGIFCVVSAEDRSRRLEERAVAQRQELLIRAADRRARATGRSHDPLLDVPLATGLPVILPGPGVDRPTLPADPEPYAGFKLSPGQAIATGILALIPVVYLWFEAFTNPAFEDAALLPTFWLGPLGLWAIHRGRRRATWLKRQALAEAYLAGEPQVTFTEAANLSDVTFTSHLAARHGLPPEPEAYLRRSLGRWGGPSRVWVMLALVPCLIFLLAGCIHEAAQPGAALGWPVTAVLLTWCLAVLLVRAVRRGRWHRAYHRATGYKPW